MIIIPNKEPDKLYQGSQAQMQLLVANCANKLQEHYPKHMWAVASSEDWSCIYIKALNISTLYGYTLHTLAVQSDPDLKSVVTAGGEVLERGFALRGKNDGTWADQLDINGVPDKSLKNAVLQDGERILKNGF